MAILTAALAIPLIGFGALAIDIGSATVARASLDAAADSAALLATTVASNQYIAGIANPTAAAKTSAAQRFNAQAGIISGVTVGTVTIAVTQAGTKFSSSVTYNGTYETSLAAVVGITSIPLKGVSAASLSVKPYVDIQVLMDVSASMLIAATDADMTHMQTLTTNFVPTPNEVVPDNAGQQCSFACHWNNLGTDYLGLAQKNGVTLRIDVLRSAVSNLITNIASFNTQAFIRLGLSTFAQSFTQIYGTSTNISGATTALSSIAPDINLCTSNCPETYFSSAMSSLLPLTPASGDGSSQANSQKFLFIVTDGLVDQVTNGNRVIGPVNPQDCAALKLQGVTILTLYTQYLPIMNNGFYLQYVWPYQSMGSPDQIQQALSSCASSPSLAYVATDSTQIDAQLQTMLATVVQTSGHFTK